MKRAMLTKIKAETADGATWRASAYRLLGLLFSYPTDSVAGRIFALSRELASSGVSDIELCGYPSLRALTEACLEYPRESLERAYISTFSHICAADCNPTETSYTSKHIFQVTDELADIDAYYRAFGVEVGGERADHISVEMEFMAYLCTREAAAIKDNNLAKAETDSKAQKVFLERHLGRWVHEFSYLLQRKQPAGPLAEAADLLPKLVTADEIRLDAKPRRHLIEAIESLESEGKTEVGETE